MSVEILRSNIERSLEIHSHLLRECLPALTAASDALISAYRAGHKALFLAMVAAPQTRSISLRNFLDAICVNVIRCPRSHSIPIAQQ